MPSTARLLQTVRLVTLSRVYGRHWSCLRPSRNPTRHGVRRNPIRSTRTTDIPMLTVRMRAPAETPYISAHRLLSSRIPNKVPPCLAVVVPCERKEVQPLRHRYRDCRTLSPRPRGFSTTSRPHADAKPEALPYQCTYFHILDRLIQLFYCPLTR